MTEFKNQSVLVAGGGISGRGAAEALARIGAHPDLREGEALCAPLSGFSLIVVSPGIPPTHPLFLNAAAAGVEVISEIELGWRINPTPVVAVTGTNGKTTTVRLIDAMLRPSRATALCGNVGVSYAAKSALGGYDCAVVEVSSFQLEHVSRFRPHIAVITGISPDHLDRHGTLERYAAEKCKIAAAQKPSDYLILSADDIPVETLASLKPVGEVCYYSVRGRVHGAYADKGTIYLFDRPLCKTDRLRLTGGHNLKNALTAALAAHLSGAGDEDIVAALSTAEADPHRIEYAGSVKGVEFYDDSKATNVAAALAGMAAVTGTVALIAGGSGKGYGYDDLFEQLPGHVRHIFVTGETADAILLSAKACGFTAISRCVDLAEATYAAYQSGCSAVLLSPASASFDRFRDYAQRGEAFRAVIEEIEQREKDRA